MPQNPSDKQSSNQLSAASEGLTPDDIKTIGEAVMDLNIARKNLLIYPASHEQVQRSTSRALGSLKRALALTSPLRLAAMKGRLCVGTSLSELKGSYAQEMAMALKERGAVAVSLPEDISGKELKAVLVLLTASPEKLKARGGIKAVASAAGVTRTRFKEVDYSRLHLTEEKEVCRQDASENTEDTWRMFVRLLAERPDAAAAGLTDGDDNIFDPSVVASMLNEEQADGRKALAYYKTLAGAFITQADSGQPAPEAFTAGLNRFHRLIKELKPDLQKQFLSVALDQVAAEKPPSLGTAQLFGGMGSELVVEMLRQANASGKPISPSLMAFIKKLGVADASDLASTLPAGDVRQVQSTMEVLLPAEDYATYVDEKYHRLLNNLTIQSTDGHCAPKPTDFDQRFAPDLDEAHIVIHTARALLGLMAASKDLESYRDWARQLTFILDDLLANKSYGPLAKIFDAVSRQCESQDDDERGKITGLILDRFNSSGFVVDLLASLDQCEGGISASAAALLDRIGEAVAAEAVDRWVAAGSREPGAGLYKVLERCRAHAVREVIERLDDVRYESMGRMLEIISNFGSAEDAEQVKPLLGRPQPQVRSAALDVMLKYENPWGLLRLREMLTAPWSEEVQHAFLLAGKHRIREVVPSLLDILKRSDPLGKDKQRREDALLALGKIGDPRAIPVFSKIVQRRWSIYQRHLRRFKLVLFESLAGYPYDAVRALLHDGLRQKDSQIVRICETLLKQHRQ